MITVTCAQCGSGLKVKPKLAGRRIKCPKCSTELLVPALDDENAVPQVDVPTNVQFDPSPQAAPPATSGERLIPQPAESTQPPSSDDAVSIDMTAAEPSYSKYVRKRKSQAPLWTVLVLLLAGGGGWAYFQFFKTDDIVLLQVEPIADQTVQELDEFDVVVRPADAHEDLTFTLVDAPVGANVDGDGRITWTPTEDQGPGRHEFRVRISSTNDEQSDAEVDFSVEVTEVNTAPEFADLPDVDGQPGEPLKFWVDAKDPDVPSADLTYSLTKGAPVGASIDATTGRISWTPQDEDAGKRIEIPVQVSEGGDGGLQSTSSVVVVVAAPRSPVELLTDALADRGAAVESTATATAQLPFTGEYRLLKVDSHDVHVFVYRSVDDLLADVEQVSATDHALFGEPWEQDTQLTLFRNDALIVACLDAGDAVRENLVSYFGRSFADVTRMPAPEEAVRSPLMETLVGLYEERSQRAQKERMLFSLRNYETLRKAVSDDFERRYEFEIQSAFGEQHDDLMEWFAERPALKEELFTAFHPEFDDVVAGLTIFRELKEKFPQVIERYSSLAIATAVTWDKERPGVYDYAHHARRTDSQMPTALLSGVENFEYLVSAEEYMQGRIVHVPWEFLTLIVNHKTPADERIWAMRNYVSQRVMFGECYAHVPYDTEMLETESKVCKLGGKDYTLPNIRQFGGVCAMQADFAARVGKSIGVPAAYVTGAGRYGELHAWVMWVELKAVSAGKISFSLESHGRYRGDRYYVGSLRDPQTGAETTDRLLALRLHAAGADERANRHAQRIMRFYPELAAELRLEFDDQVDFLSQLIGLNPWNEAAWIALSQISAEHAGELDVLQVRQMEDAVKVMFRAFAPFPDFTLAVFSDLIAFEPEIEERIKLYFQLLDVYANAERPDLAFQALLTTSDLLVENDRSDDAIRALAATIKKYADEGQYVPRILDKLEELHAASDGAEEAMLRFYDEFLPLIPTKRFDRPSKYCISMHERGIARFREAGESKAAALYEQRLELIRAGKAE